MTVSLTGIVVPTFAESTTTFLTFIFWVVDFVFFSVEYLH